MTFFACFFFFLFPFSANDLWIEGSSDRVVEGPPVVESPPPEILMTFFGFFLFFLHFFLGWELHWSGVRSLAYLGCRLLLENYILFFFFFFFFFFFLLF